MTRTFFHFQETTAKISIQNAVRFLQAYRLIKGVNQESVIN